MATQKTNRMVGFWLFVLFADLLCR